MNCRNEREIEYPAELIIKAVFRTGSHHPDSIRFILAEMDIDSTIASKESSGGRFTSYTVTAVYRSSEELDIVCRKISGLEGFMTLF